MPETSFEHNLFIYSFWYCFLPSKVSEGASSDPKNRCVCVWSGAFRAVNRETSIISGKQRRD